MYTRIVYFVAKMFEIHGKRAFVANRVSRVAGCRYTRVLFFNHFDVQTTYETSRKCHTKTIREKGFVAVI